MEKSQPKRTFTKTSIQDKIFCLDRFKEKEFAKVSHDKLGKLAAKWLKRDKPFGRATIGNWLKEEPALRLFVHIICVYGPVQPVIKVYSEVLV